MSMSSTQYARMAMTSVILVLTAAAAATSAPKPLPAPKPSPAPTPPPSATIGLPAPQLTLIDIDDQTHQLSDYAGRIVVLEWFNAECPYSGRRSPHSIHSSGKASSLRKNLHAVDPQVMYLIIDSTARNHKKAAVIAGNQSARKSWKIEAPILIDFDGKVGRSYKAQTTPHMFVIDTAGILRYQGAFDDDRKNKSGETATNYVLEAVKKLKVGELPAPSNMRPWGCGVKY
ncbi:MAG: redoxin domain-containing protein [Phycisphaerales bacterium]|nr:redoxin domain-containing protein [Phycisphaerales bacterium]